jgi:hypothetical protein
MAWKGLELNVAEATRTAPKVVAATQKLPSLAPDMGPSDRELAAADKEMAWSEFDSILLEEPRAKQPAVGKPPTLALGQDEESMAAAVEAEVTSEVSEKQAVKAGEAFDKRMKMLHKHEDAMYKSKRRLSEGRYGNAVVRHSESVIRERLEKGARTAEAAIKIRTSTEKLAKHSSENAAKEKLSKKNLTNEAAKKRLAAQNKAKHAAEKGVKSGLEALKKSLAKEMNTKTATAAHEAVTKSSGKAVHWVLRKATESGKSPPFREKAEGVLKPGSEKSKKAISKSKHIKGEVCAMSCYLENLKKQMEDTKKKAKEVAQKKPKASVPKKAIKKAVKKTSEKVSKAAKATKKKMLPLLSEAEHILMKQKTREVGFKHAMTQLTIKQPTMDLAKELIATDDMESSSAHDAAAVPDGGSCPATCQNNGACLECHTSWCDKGGKCQLMPIPEEFQTAKQRKAAEAAKAAQAAKIKAENEAAQAKVKAKQAAAAKAKKAADATGKKAADQKKKAEEALKAKVAVPKGKKKKKKLTFAEEAAKLQKDVQKAFTKVEADLKKAKLTKDLTALEKVDKGLQTATTKAALSKAIAGVKAVAAGLKKSKQDKMAAEVSVVATHLEDAVEAMVGKVHASAVSVGPEEQAALKKESAAVEAHLKKAGLEDEAKKLHDLHQFLEKGHPSIAQYIKAASEAAKIEASVKKKNPKLAKEIHALGDHFRRVMEKAGGKKSGKKKSGKKKKGKKKKGKKKAVVVKPPTPHCDSQCEHEKANAVLRAKVEKKVVRAAEALAKIAIKELNAKKLRASKDKQAKLQASVEAAAKTATSRQAQEVIFKRKEAEKSSTAASVAKAKAAGAKKAMTMEISRQQKVVEQLTKAEANAVKAAHANAAKARTQSQHARKAAQQAEAKAAANASKAAAKANKEKADLAKAATALQRKRLQAMKDAMATYGKKKPQSAKQAKATLKKQVFQLAEKKAKEAIYKHNQAKKATKAKKKSPLRAKEVRHKVAMQTTLVAAQRKSEATVKATTRELTRKKEWMAYMEKGVPSYCKHTCPGLARKQAPVSDDALTKKLKKAYAVECRVCLASFDEAGGCASLVDGHSMKAKIFESAQCTHCREAANHHCSAEPPNSNPANKKIVVAFADQHTA